MRCSNAASSAAAPRSAWAAATRDLDDARHQLPFYEKPRPVNGKVVVAFWWVVVLRPTLRMAYQRDPWQRWSPGVGCAIGTPSAWVFLVGLRPRRAQLRFARHLHLTWISPRSEPPSDTGAMPQKIQPDEGRTLHVGGIQANRRPSAVASSQRPDRRFPRRGGSAFYGGSRLFPSKRPDDVMGT